MADHEIGPSSFHGLSLGAAGAVILTVKVLIDHLQTLVHDASATASLTVREASVPSEPLRQRQTSTQQGTTFGISYHREMR